MAGPARKSFEQNYQELEKLLGLLEDGNTSLEEALSCYERGITLVKECHMILNDSETRVRELVGVDENDNMSLQHFEGKITQG